MHLSSFKIESIGAMHSDMRPPFARCKAIIHLRDDDGLALDVVKLDVVISYDKSDTVDIVQKRILAKVFRVLDTAASLTKDRDVEGLLDLAAEDEVRRQPLEDADNSARVDAMFAADSDSQKEPTPA